MVYSYIRNVGMSGLYAYMDGSARRNPFKTGSHLLNITLKLVCINKLVPLQPALYLEKRPRSNLEESLLNVLSRGKRPLQPHLYITKGMRGMRDFTCYQGDH